MRALASASIPDRPDRHAERRARSVDRHRARPRDHDTRDRGQAAIVVVAVATVMAMIIVIGLADLGRTSAQRTRAQSAADSAALASLAEGRRGAADLAARHGATVVSWRRGPGPHEVTVSVRIGDVTASARATDAP